MAAIPKITAPPNEWRNIPFKFSSEIQLVLVGTCRNEIVFKHESKIQISKRFFAYHGEGKSCKVITDVIISFMYLYLGKTVFSVPVAYRLQVRICSLLRGIQCFIQMSVIWIMPE